MAMWPAIDAEQAASEVHAYMESGSLARPPRVSLSFPGLTDPVELWDDLESIGWVVPARPPRPAAAIDWSEPDGFGQPFTVRPYRVNDFRLLPGPWPSSVRSRIGALTVSLFQRHNVRVHAEESYLRMLFPGRVDEEKAQEIDLRSPADPTPDTVIIERASDSIARLCDYRTFGARTGLFFEPIVWAERARQVSRNELRSQRSVVRNSVHAWRISGGDAPDTPEGDDRSLRIIVPDVRKGGELVASLKSHMGDRVGSLALTPMEGAPNTHHAGLMIVGLVAVDRIGRVRDVLLDRYPAIIVRV